MELGLGPALPRLQYTHTHTYRYLNLALEFGARKIFFRSAFLSMVVGLSLKPRLMWQPDHKVKNSDLEVASRALYFKNLCQRKFTLALWVSSWWVVVWLICNKSAPVISPVYLASHVSRSTLVFRALQSARVRTLVVKSYEHRKNVGTTCNYLINQFSWHRQNLQAKVNKYGLQNKRWVGGKELSNTRVPLIHPTW